MRSVTGSAHFYPKSRPGHFPLRRLDQIELGSTIVTDRNSSVLIQLGDGSQIKVLQNSKVVLREFSAAASVPELLEIWSGRVQVRIHHVGSKPNPYRLNSPSASIAVRGTEFIVDVQQNGETTVYVQEGQVEVWPRNNPENKRLVTPGGSVIVRPGGDISLAIPGPGSELNGITRFNSDIGSIYQASVDSLVQSTKMSPPFFSAFADSHIDSLENPAYASEFKSAEGRLSMVPSISLSNNFFGNDASKPPNDYTLAPEMTFFTPIEGTRLTVGGGLSALRTRLTNLVSYSDPTTNIHDSDSQFMKLDAINASLLASYKLGAKGKTSLGIGIDKLTGYGYFLNGFDYSNMETSDKQTINSEAKLNRTSITLGMVHKFSESTTLGVYYSTGFNSSDQKNETTPESTNFFGGGTEFPPGRSLISAISTEAGVRFRAPITKHLFYGIEGSYLYERMKSRQQLNQIVDNRRFLERRARFGGGLGFVPTSRIIINADVSGGLFNTSKPEELYYIQYNLLPLGNLDETVLPNPSIGYRESSLSTHIAAQGRIWRNAFASSSFIESFGKGTIYYYDSYSGSQYPLKYQLSSNLIGNIGFGWKFKQGLTAEYLFSREYRQVASHSIILRYTFNFHKEE
ncbi:MAG: FecR domain-containing protein [Blastocatellia bacterium]|nr:FecR domain-containing protein [Blastocatellia bacterium]